jgi:hypothetical protein
MRTATRLLGVSLVLGVVLPLAGCGGENSIEDYCAALKADQKQIAEMIESPSSTALLSNLPMLRRLAEQAPDDLTDEWQVFLGALDGLDQALDDAGLKPSDYEDGRPPAGVSAADRKAIAAAASQITTDEVSAAASGIDQQARDVCKINLGIG